MYMLYLIIKTYKTAALVTHEMTVSDVKGVDYNTKPGVHLSVMQQ